MKAKTKQKVLFMLYEFVVFVKLVTVEGFERLETMLKRKMRR